MKLISIHRLNLLLVAALLVAALGIASPTVPARAANFTLEGEPDTIITTTPPDPDSDNTPTFTFDESGGRGGVTFMCRMDGGSYAACSSPYTSPPLADGSHTFEVYAISQAGIPDPTPAAYSWWLDATAPVLTLPANMTLPPTSAAGAVATFTVTATDNFDPDPTVVCVPPSGSTFPIGATTVNCTATDDLGNVANGSFTITVGGTAYTPRFRSNGAYDGTLRESTETSGISNMAESTSTLISVGDDSLKRQYVGILDFDTSSLPDNAIIASAKIQVKVMVISKGVYAKLGNLTADVTNPYFGTSPGLQNMDFGARKLANAGNFTKATTYDQWITLRMKSNSLFAINTIGRTQFRLHFTLDDNNDGVKHEIRFLSGDYWVVRDQPTLIVTYYIP